MSVSFPWYFFKSARTRDYTVFAPLGCCMAYVGSWLGMFRDTVSVPSSKVKQSKISNGPFKIRLVSHPKTSVTKYQPMPCNFPEEQRP